MNSLWFNVRFGEYHVQIGKDRFHITHNPFHARARESSDWKWFEVYTFFGKIL